MTIGEDTTPTALSPSPVVGKEPNFALNQVFADETLSVLAHEPDYVRRPAVSIFSTTTPDVILSKPPTQRSRRSFSMNDIEYTPPPAIMSAVVEHDRVATSPVTMSLTTASPGDWGDFATGGFGATGANGSGLASTLKGFDKSASDSAAEVTEFGRKSSLKPSGSRRAASPKRVSMDGTVLNNGTSSPKEPSAPKRQPAQISVHPTTIEIDEAFIDIWADNIHDSLPAANWPTFALCQLKTPASLEQVAGDGPRSLQWVVIEQVLVDPPKPVPMETPIGSLSPSKRPTPSVKGRNRLSGFIPGFRTRQSTDQGLGLEPASPVRTSMGGPLTRVLSRSASKKRLRAESGVKELGDSVKEEVPPMPTAPEKVPLPSDLTPTGEKSPASPSTAVEIAAAAVGGGIALVGAGVGALTSVLSNGLSPAAPAADVPAFGVEKTPKPAATELAVGPAPSVEPVERQPSPPVTSQAVVTGQVTAKPDGHDIRTDSHVATPPGA